MPQLQEHIDLVVQRNSLTTLNDEGRSNIHELFLIKYIYIYIYIYIYSRQTQQ